MSGYNSGTFLLSAGTGINITRTGATYTIACTVTGTTDHGALTGLSDDDHTQYHTDARALTWLNTRSTSDLPEGSRLYYTDARFDTRFSAKSTTDLTEGSNLYFTDQRAADAIGNIVSDTDNIVWNYNGAGPVLVANTVQDIATFAQPTFDGLNITSLLNSYGETHLAKNTEWVGSNFTLAKFGVDTPVNAYGEPLRMVYREAPNTIGFDNGMDDAWTSFQAANYYGSWAGSPIDASYLGNGDVDNTELSYLNGVTSGIQSQLNLKAPLASPTLTGIPTAPTAATATNTTQIATTAYVKNQGYLTANQTITLSGDISGSGTTGITTTIGANKVTLPMMAQVGTQTFLGRNTASTGNVESLSVSTVRTMLSISNVENTALSTWAGSTNITTLGTIATGTWNATAIGVTKGGTGLTTTTQGDILYADASNSIAKLAKNTSATRYLSNTGTTNNPAWAQIDLTNGVTGALPAANGGTGQSSYTTGDILYASAATTVSKLADVATGNALISGGVGAAPSWGKIGLTTHISGTLATGNGGTGVTSLSDILGTSNQITVTSGTARVIGGNVTLSLPQNIHTAATPTFGGATLSGTGQIPLLVTGSNAGSYARYGTTNNNYIQLTSSDASVGFWIRNDGSNPVISTKVGDLYLGYSGRVGMVHRFGTDAGSPTLVVENDIGGKVYIKNPHLSDENDIFDNFPIFEFGSDNAIPIYGTTPRMFWSGFDVGRQRVELDTGSEESYLSFAAGTITGEYGFYSGSGYNNYFNGPVSVTGSNALDFGSTTRQMLNLWSTQYALGVQSSTLYMRTGAGWAVYRGGTHSNTQWDPGSGGVELLRQNNLGALQITTTSAVGQEAFKILQNDADQAFIEYDGTFSSNSPPSNDGNVLSYDEGDGNWEFYRWVMVEVEGTKSWMKTYRWCVTGDTLILTPTGLRRIDEMKIGDLVISIDEATGQTIHSIVQDIQVHPSTVAFVRINNNLQITPNHRIYLNNSWQPAGNARVGDVIRGPEFEEVEVTSVEVYQLDTPVSSYNLTLDSANKNYLANDVLIHNAKCPRIDAWIHGQWVEVGRAIKYLNSIEKKGLWLIDLPLPLQRFRLVEDEPEVSYIDYIKANTGEVGLENIITSPASFFGASDGSIHEFTFSTPVTQLKTYGYYDEVKTDGN
jgi:hypothetical protein